MKRATQVGFIGVFLGVIYVVPVVQTVYEYRTNPDHRIQMLDLPRDLFITPLEKRRADRAQLDTLARLVEEIGDVARTGGGTEGSAIERIESAVLTVSLLKKRVVEYNRHVTGAANAVAAHDTVQPYYRCLTELGNLLEEVRGRLESGEAAQETLSRIQSTLSKAQSAASRYNYVTLTLTALRRIMVGANYLRPYESEMEKSSLFASTIRPWMLYADLRLFGDPGSKGVRGRAGWLFYRPDVEYLVRPDVFDVRSRQVDANDVAFTEDIVGAVVDFKEQLASQGIDLLFVAMPTKASIYPDQLNARISPEQSGRLSHTQEVLRRLRQAGVETVDLFGVLAKERGRDGESGDSIYLRTDTHFKGRGVVAVARAVAERVRQYAWYRQGSTEFMVDTVMVPRYGDVAEMIGVPASVVAARRPPFAAESTVCYQVYEVRRKGDGAVEAKTLYKDDLRASPILVLGDSYSRIYQTDAPKSAGWISHLARELSQPVASVVSDGGSSTLVRQTLARKPGLLKKRKLVIWEVVERDFRFGEEGWKKIAIAGRQ